MGEVVRLVRYNTAGVITGSYIGSCEARYTHSWRSKAPSGSFDPKGSTFGIRPPRHGANIVDTLTDRKRWIEEIAATAAGAQPNGSTISGATKVYPSLDTGHTFTSVRWNAYPATVEYWERLNYPNPVITIQGGVLPFGIASVPAFADVPAGFPKGNPSGVSFPTALQRQDKTNLMFHSMNPSKRRAQIGETLVSLLRGDVPTILKNVRKGIREGKKAYRSLGSEYLNVQFGWVPLIGDIQDAIEVLTHLDTLIYDGGERRKRGYAWQTQVTTVSSNGLRLSQYNRDGPTPPGAIIGPAGNQTINVIASCDMRLSARLTPITRRTLAATDFISQAGDVASQLGLWYPALGWDLLPYSWLVDWATNIGRSLENSLTYGSKPGQLNVDYAWATTCSKYLATQNYLPRRTATQWFNPLQPVGKELTVVKDRVQGSPFGFGVAFDGLNAFQMSILAALGLAKSR